MEIYCSFMKLYKIIINYIQLLPRSKRKILSYIALAEFETSLIKLAFTDSNYYYFIKALLEIALTNTLELNEYS